MGTTKGVKDAEEHQYIQFPLCLLQGIFDDMKTCLNTIIAFGTVNYAQKFKYDLRDVARQLMYDYYRNTEKLQGELTEKLESFIDNDQLTTDEDYNGFTGSMNSPAFDVEDNIAELFILFEADTEFKNDAIMNYRLHMAGGSLRIGWPNNDTMLTDYRKGDRLRKQFEHLYGRDCWPSAKLNMLFEFRDNGSDLELLLGFIALKSLQGQKSFIATTRNVILMRMMGCKTNAALQDFLKRNKKAKVLYNKYARSQDALRYNFDKLFNKLLTNGFLRSKIYMRNVSRKIFFSITLSYDELTQQIILFSQKRNHKKYEKQARLKIRAALN